MIDYDKTLKSRKLLPQQNSITIVKNHETHFYIKSKCINDTGNFLHLLPLTKGKSKIVHVAMSSTSSIFNSMQDLEDAKF